MKREVVVSWPARFEKDGMEERRQEMAKLVREKLAQVKAASESASAPSRDEGPVRSPTPQR